MFWVILIVLALLFKAPALALIVGFCWLLKKVLPTLIVEALPRVPKNQFAELDFLGKRFSEPRYEGLCPKIPGLMNIECFSLEIEPYNVETKFMAADNAWLTISGVAHIRPDPDVKRKDGPNKGHMVFPEVSETEITSRIASAIQAKIGGIGGKVDSEKFRANRQALSDIINEALRMKTPLHLRHTTCANANCAFAGKLVAAKDLIGFSNLHHRQIKEDLDNEKANVADHSALEESLGIDIVKFDLTNVDFSPETKAAFEEKKQVDLRARALETMREEALRLKNDLGMDGREAFDDTQSVLQPEVTKHITSVHGGLGILGAFLPKPASSQTAQSPPSPQPQQTSPDPSRRKKGRKK